MMLTEPLQTADTFPLEATTAIGLPMVQDKEPVVLTNIFQEQTNIVIWRRELSQTLKSAVSDFLVVNPAFKTAMTVTPQDALTCVSESLGDAAHFSELSENMAELVDMFCYLFELKRVGLRITALNHAMCPKFHVDKIPCRMVTTYQGSATEWLPNQYVNREKLGIGSQGQLDSESGLFQNSSDIQQLAVGDVALLKGERWLGNENAGLVHRSPALTRDESRLLLTLDFSD